MSLLGEFIKYVESEWGVRIVAVKSDIQSDSFESLFGEFEEVENE